MSSGPLWEGGGGVQLPWVSGWLGERVWARVILFFGLTLQLAGSSLPLGIEPAAWAVRTIALIAGSRGNFQFRIILSS